MPSFIHRFVLLVTGFTHAELLRHIEFLKAENQILRSRLPKRIILKPAERNRLVKLGRAIGPAIKEMITIVSPRTFARWVAGKKRVKPSAKIGRRPTAPEIQELILRLARENSWGYTRILGELRKLGINNVSRSTVVNILKANGLDPGPKRGHGSWDEFIKRHASTLWACDFISKKIWTGRGLVDYFVLFFIHFETRRIILAPITANPTGEWIAQQTKNFVMEVEDIGANAEYLVHDWDTKFTQQSDALFKSEDIQICRVGPMKPNLNALAERFAQTLQSECLDHFIVLGKKHLSHILAEFLAYYHEERPHQSMDNRPLIFRTDTGPPADQGDILCRHRLGRLLKHYYRQAA